MANEAMLAKKPSDAVKVMAPLVADADKNETMKKDPEVSLLRFFR